MNNKLDLVTLIAKRVLITFSVFMSSVVVIYFTFITPMEQDISCDRPCNNIDWPRICRFKFVIEKRELTERIDCNSFEGNSKCRRSDFYFTVNRKFQGPTLNVCKNDYLVIDIENKVPGQSIAVHWGGQSQQVTPFMDGVPMITQCPITSFSTFQYKFQAKNAGTHLYQGFSGFEKRHGIFGALVVRSKGEINGESYEYDNHTFVITSFKDQMLINGESETSFLLEPNSRYRLRTSSVGGEISLEIEKHEMLLIAIDGNLVEPVKIKQIILSDGDRYDVILKTDQMPGDYKIVINGNGATSRFVLKYNSVDLVSHENSNTSSGITLNSFKNECSESEVCMVNIKSKTAFPGHLRDVDKSIYLPIKRRIVERTYFGGTYSASIFSLGNITFTFPSTLLLQTSHENLRQFSCSRQDMPKRCRSQAPTCDCVHVENIEIGQRVEIILINEDQYEDHVFHLHGYKFYIVGSHPVSSGSPLKVLNRLERNFDRPLIKDVVKVQRNTVIMIRFIADHAGLWMLRDEGSEDWTRGLDVVLNVGRHHNKIEFPDKFPTCENFVGPKYFFI